MSVAARYRYTLVAGATAVVIGTGFTAVGLSKHSGAATTSSRVADSAPLAASAGATPPAVDEILLGDSAGPSAPASPSRTATRPASPSPSPSAVKRSAAARHTPRPTRSPSSTAAPTKAPETGGTILDQVLAHINAARTAEGLGTLTLSADLSKASALHNQLMIGGCGLSHQCPGEDSIGPRFSAQGVNWTSAGENIGFGSSGASDAEEIKAANGLTDSMLAEVPPDDGHRKNLLSKDFKRIGLSVVRDSKGITWMTQDFVN